MQTYIGNDNYGNPKQQYLTQLAGMSDSELGIECYSMIYLSAQYDDTPHADWHWRVRACFDEAHRRDATERIYTAAYERCYQDHAEPYDEE